MNKKKKLLLETFEDRILCSVSLPAGTLGDGPQLDPNLAPTNDQAVVAAPPAPESGDAATTNASAELTSEQRAAIEQVVRDSTDKIFFQENVGQFPEGVRYGFNTTFGAMLVYDDHLRVISLQSDAATGIEGAQVIDLTFPGSDNDWDIVTGDVLEVTGSYHTADGETYAPRLFSEITLRGVYDGVDLRLYSAQKGILEFDWILARAQDYENIRIAATGQDGIVFNADGSATLDLRFQDLAIKMPEVYQVIDGEKVQVSAKMAAGSHAGEIRYEITDTLVADAPLVIDPSVSWSTFFDADQVSFDAYLFAMAVNENGVYCFGSAEDPIAENAAYMDVAAGFSPSPGGSTAQDAIIIYRLNGTGTAITAWTSTGVSTSDTGAVNQTLVEAPVDIELFPDGRVLAVFSSGKIHIYSADLSTQQYAAEQVVVDVINSVAIVDNNTFYAGGRVSANFTVGAGAGQVGAIGPDTTRVGLEGYVLRYTGASTAAGATGLTAQWGTYVGGDADEYFTAVMLTPDKTKLVFATTSAVAAVGTYPAMVNAVDSTPSGTTEVLAGVLNDQATAPASFDVFTFLGGSGTEGTILTNTTAVQVAATNTHFYVAGNTSSDDFPGVAGSEQTTRAGSVDIFLSRIAIGGGMAGFQSSYLGGTAEDNIGGIAFDTRAGKLLVFGSTQSNNFPVEDTTPASAYYDNSFGGGVWDIIVATYNAGLTTKEFATYIGGTANDYLGQTGDLIGQGHIIYSEVTGLSYLGTTIHSQTLGAGAQPVAPSNDITDTNAAEDTHYIIAFNANTLDFGDAPISYDVNTASAARENTSVQLRLGLTTDNEGNPTSSALANGDDITNSGAVDDEDGVAAVPVLNLGSSSYSLTVSVMNNSGAARTLRGWIDFDRDGIFEAGEIATVAVPNNAAQQNAILTWTIPANIVAGQSFARLRLSDGALADNGATPIDERSIGLGGAGEIEDHALTIAGSSISGTVYSDNDNDGIIDAGETGIGTDVTLTGTDDMGNLVNVTVTSDGVTGAYSFTNLRPSNAAGYIITETQPGAFLDGKETTGTGTTNAGTVNNGAVSNTISGVVLGTGQTGINFNFGELNPASLSGSVYGDLDNNGVIDGFETGIPGVTVTLTGTNDFGAIAPIAVLTDANGNYSFTALRPGTYTITETQPSGYNDGLDTLGTGLAAPNVAGSGAVSDVFSGIVFNTVIAGNNTGVNYNFGESPNFDLTKTLQASSVVETTGNNLVVGEIATFRLVATIPAGSYGNFQLMDTLPAGFQFINGSAVVALVSPGGELTSTLIGGGAAQTSIGTPTFVMPDAAVSNSATANTDAYGSGTDVFFKFGTLANSDTTAAVEAVVIEFQALVINEIGNQAGVSLPNSFSVLFNKDGVGGPDPHGTPSVPHTSTVVEPVLTFDKTNNAAGTVSAGDNITYTLTITNPAGANSAMAYDALVIDNMPAGIRITSITGTTLNGGATADSAAVITLLGGGLVGQYDIPVGGSVVITYVGTVQPLALLGSTQTNNAEVTWTSTNGGNSLLPDSGERFGFGTNLLGDGSLNDYRLTDSTSVTVGVASFDKQFFSTSDPATAGNNVGIGEAVTYALIVTLPAGTAPSLSIVDTLPTGLQYVSSLLVTTAAASGGLLTQDFNGTVPAPTVSGGATDGADVTFNFGSITANPDGNSANNTFLVLITARVTDIPGNEGILPGQTTLPNSAQFEIPFDGQPPFTPPPVTVTVVEPVLTIDKEFNVTSADAGDTVQISITVNNTGTGPAHDVLVTDIVNTAKFGSITPVTIPPGYAYNNTAGTVTFSGGTIAAGGSATFVFSVQLLNTVTQQEILLNTATAIATTQPGPVPGERTTPQVSDNDSIFVPAVFDVTKSIVTPGPTVQIGDVVTYSVVVRVVEGTTNSLNLADNIPSNVDYLPGTAVVSAADPGVTVNGFAANFAAGVLTMTATSVVNAGNVDNAATTDSDTFTITYQAVVRDIAGNTNGTNIINNLNATASPGLVDNNNTATTTIIEPALRVVKAVNDAAADLGQTLHFTLTVSHAPGSNATAYDVLVRDVLPAGLGNLANILVNGVAAGVSPLVDSNNSTTGLLDLKLSQLAVGGTITIEFDATVGGGAALVGTTIDNNARIYWDSQPGEGTNTILAGGVDGDQDRDYGATGADEAFNVDTQDAQDTERFTVNGNSLSGVVCGIL